MVLAAMVIGVAIGHVARRSDGQSPTADRSAVLEERKAVVSEEIARRLLLVSAMEREAACRREEGVDAGAEDPGSGRGCSRERLERLLLCILLAEDEQACAPDVPPRLLGALQHQVYAARTESLATSPREPVVAAHSRALALLGRVLKTAEARGYEGLEADEDFRTLLKDWREAMHAFLRSCEGAELGNTACPPGVQFRALKEVPIDG